MTGLETNNRYDILNTMGQPIFKAIEINNCCFLNCCGSYRCFHMKILNNAGMEVMHLERPLRCNGSCFPFCCCGQEMKVYSPPGQLIGRIVQNISFCGARFEIRDENDQPQLRVNGPCCVFDFCGNVDFRVLPLETDTQIGVVTKQWSGLAKEAFTDADNFGVCFPIDLEVRMKALLMAQIILIVSVCRCWELFLGPFCWVLMKGIGVITISDLG